MQIAQHFSVPIVRQSPVPIDVLEEPWRRSQGGDDAAIPDLHALGLVLGRGEGKRERSKPRDESPPNEEVRGLPVEP